MQNGTYLITGINTGAIYKLVSYNGTLKAYDKKTNNFIKVIDENILNRYYVIGKKMEEEKVMYDVGWFVNGNIKAVIRVNAPYPVCMAKIKDIKSIYTVGLLRPIRK